MQKIIASLTLGLVSAAFAAQAAVVDVTVIGQYDLDDWQDVYPDVAVSMAPFDVNDELTVNFRFDDSSDFEIQLRRPFEVSTKVIETRERRFWTVEKVSVDANGREYLFEGVLRQEQTISTSTNGRTERERSTLDTTLFLDPIENFPASASSLVNFSLREQFGTSIPFPFDPILGLSDPNDQTLRPRIYFDFPSDGAGVPTETCDETCDTFFDITSVNVSPVSPDAIDPVAIDPIAPVPLPASLGFLLAGLGGLGIARTRKRRL